MTTKLFKITKHVLDTCSEHDMLVFTEDELFEAFSELKEFFPGMTFSFNWSYGSQLKYKDYSLHTYDPCSLWRRFADYFFDELEDVFQSMQARSERHETVDLL